MESAKRYTFSSRWETVICKQEQGLYLRVSGSGFLTFNPEIFGGLCFFSTSRDESNQWPYFPRTGQGDASNFKSECHLSLLKAVPSAPISWLAL